MTTGIRAKSRALHELAADLMPLGVNSNTRFWGETETLYIDRAKGGYVWDVDGNRYIDFRLAFGPIILGYAYEAVDAQVAAALQRGVTVGLTSKAEITLAETIIAACPAVEQVRLVNSGTEATLHAIRVARAFTGREKIVKFEGGYHGSHDYVLFSTYAPPETYGHPRHPIAVPASSGIPSALRDLIITLPFNNREALARTLRTHGHEVAAIITEPFLGNYGAIEPEPGFLDFIRTECDHHGILMILDEVKSGFRLAIGGAQEIYDLRPDLATYAKALGNGYPIAAYGGRRDVMSVIGRGVTQGGTYSGNGIGVAAALATLACLKGAPVYAHLATVGERLQTGLRAIFAEAGIPALISRHPAMFSVSLGVEHVLDARGWARSNRRYYQQLAAKLRARGILVDEDPREPWCLCYSHTLADVDTTLEQVASAVRSLDYH